MVIEPELKIRKMWLYLTERCNERCIYCEDREYFTKPKDTSLEIIDAAMSFIEANKQTTDIELWGGEPLLRLDLIKHCVKKYPQHSYLLTTNGVLFQDESIMEGIGHLILSEDGAKYNQDRQRPLRDGGSSFDKLNWDLLVKFTPTVHVVRFPGGRNLVEDIQFLISKGFDKFQIEYAEGSCPTQDDLETYYKELEEIAERYFNYVINWDTFGEVFGNDENKFMREGEITITVDTKGDMYLTCFFSRRDYLKFGNVFKGYDLVVLDEVLKRFRKAELCRECICHNNCIHMSTIAMYTERETLPKILSDQCNYLRIEHEIVLKAKAKLNELSQLKQKVLV